MLLSLPFETRMQCLLYAVRYLEVCHLCLGFLFVCFYSDSQIRICFESGLLNSLELCRLGGRLKLSLNAFYMSLIVTRAKCYGLNVPPQALFCFGFCSFLYLFVCNRFHYATWLSRYLLCRPGWPQTCTNPSTSACTNSKLII